MHMLLSIILVGPIVFKKVLLMRYDVPRPMLLGWQMALLGPIFLYWQPSCRTAHFSASFHFHQPL
jgi:hypothetical protein